MLPGVRPQCTHRTAPYPPASSTRPTGHFRCAAAVFSIFHACFVDGDPPLAALRHAKVAQASERPVSEPEEVIRSCMDALSKDQEEFTAQMAETLAALESYEQQLLEWQANLVSDADHLAEQQQEFEQQQNQLAKQHATDVARTAELDQAQAEIDELRRRLAEATDTLVVSETDTTPQTATAVATASSSVVGLMDPAVSAVAKQFHKLRQQQAARRGNRSTDGN